MGNGEHAICKKQQRYIVSPFVYDAPKHQKPKTGKADLALPICACKMATYKHEAGFMPAGNDLHSAEMTIADAKKMADEKPECLGFTFEGPPGEPPADAVLQIHFRAA